MERWSGKVAVVTGASSGIGLATAKALVHHGMIVIGLARRVEKMQNEMKMIKGKGKFFAKSCDVAKENDVVQSFAWIEKNFQTVHVLVNNAGTLKPATIEEIKTEDMQHVINVNVMGLLYCTRQALTMMKKHGHEAHIVNINSVAGHRVPDLGLAVNVYPATKYAVTAISESLVNEIRNENNKIRVTSISPGVVKTEIIEADETISAVVSKMPALKSEDVADSIVHVVSAPPHVQITELTIKPLGQPI